jgi:hypothetical protein
MSSDMDSTWCGAYGLPHQNFAYHRPVAARDDQLGIELHQWQQCLAELSRDFDLLAGRASDSLRVRRAFPPMATTRRAGTISLDAMADSSR